MTWYNTPCNQLFNHDLPEKGGRRTFESYVCEIISPENFGELDISGVEALDF